MLTGLFQVIAHKVNLTDADKELCMSVFEPKKIIKNTVLESENSIPKNLYFISSGILRTFYYDRNGDEITTRISVANSFITSFLNFIHDVKSMDIVATVTDAELLQISKPDLKNLIEQSQHFRDFSVTIFEEAIRSAEVRANDLATLSARQRYDKLLDTHPTILQFVPIQCIASFLGIKPESLSRIRRKKKS